MYTYDFLSVVVAMATKIAFILFTAISPSQPLTPLTPSTTPYPPPPISTTPTPPPISATSPPHPPPALSTTPTPPPQAQYDPHSSHQRPLRTPLPQCPARPPPPPPRLLSVPLTFAVPFRPASGLCFLRLVLITHNVFVFSRRCQCRGSATQTRAGTLTRDATKSRQGVCPLRVSCRRLLLSFESFLYV